MRKLFRMKHEPCAGECYAPSDVMRIHTLGLDARAAAAFLRRLLKMHAPACGNPDLEFRLDVDEFTRGQWLAAKVDQRFVASFYCYGDLHLFGGDTPLEAMNKMIDYALAYYESPQFIATRDGYGDRAEVCHHGTDDKLVNFMIEHSGLDADGRATLRAEFAQ